MIAPWWAAALTTALLGIGDLCNRRWFGWLPDDPPRPGRKQHARPIPLAGILVVPPMLAWLAMAWPMWSGAPWAAFAILVAAGVGFVDDRGKEHGRDLGWRPKAIGLGIAAAAAATACCDPLAAPLGWLARVVLVFVLTNAVNFLDNTDGVASSLAAVALLAAGRFDGGGDSAWLTAAGWTALAFVPWNWPRPRLFLGDAGAYALGIAMALAVARSTPLLGPTLALVAVPLADFAQVVVARLWLGLPPWVGDRRHLTHIAQNLGVARWLVAPMFAGLALAVIVVAVAVAAATAARR
jgi:UDP-N-acetylmuramyl pentapeptide phosphotransferase/UDP-N-acetylglucosamine-1-phosphate transferase